MSLNASCFQKCRFLPQIGRSGITRHVQSCSWAPHLFPFPSAVQRRSLPQIPNDSNAARSRLAKSDENIGARTQLKPRTKAQYLQSTGSQGVVVTRRSLLTPPASGTNSTGNSRVAVARYTWFYRFFQDILYDFSHYRAGEILIWGGGWLILKMEHCAGAVVV